MEVDRPSQKKQPSRKGKRAWRKNIDLNDVTEGLEEARSYERTMGTKQVGTENLFQVDIAGDENLKVKNLKPLKSDEILSRRSAVPALASRKTKQRPISSKEEARLRKLAGRDSSYTKSAAMALVEKDGLLRSEYQYDPWGDNDNGINNDNDSNDNKNKKDANIPVNANKSFGFAKASTRPQTLDKKPQAPIPNAVPVSIPHEGRSYNPALDAWKALVQEEYEKEAEREKQRQELLEAQNRVEELIIKLNEQEINKLAEEDDFSDENSETDHYKSEAEQELSARLSVNAPVQRKKKTRADRNKQKRHQERIKLQEQLRGLKSQLNDLHRLPTLLNEEKERIKQIEEKQLEESTSEPRSKRKMHSRYEIAEANLEIKLSDELADCLRRLRPEGNLIQDRFRSLQERGLIETRVRVTKRRKYKQKFTEKWQFKDIKL